MVTGIRQSVPPSPLPDFYPRVSLFTRDDGRQGSSGQGPTYINRSYFGSSRSRSRWTPAGGEGQSPSPATAIDRTIAAVSTVNRRSRYSSLSWCRGSCLGWSCPVRARGHGPGPRCRLRHPSRLPGCSRRLFPCRNIHPGSPPRDLFGSRHVHPRKGVGVVDSPSGGGGSRRVTVSENKQSKYLPGLLWSLRVGVGLSRDRDSSGGLRSVGVPCSGSFIVSIPTVPTSVPRERSSVSVGTIGTCLRPLTC